MFIYGINNTGFGPNGVVGVRYVDDGVFSTTADTASTF